MEPIDASNYESRRFDLTTRFRCLNKLYQQLSTIHKQVIGPSRRLSCSST